MTDADVTVSKTDKEIIVTASVQKSFMKLNISQKALIVNPEEKIRRMRWLK